MLNSARDWPPPYTQELATALRSVPQFPEREHNKDADYTLGMAIAELGEWLPALPEDKPTTADRESLADDLDVAILSRGQEVRSRTCAAELLAAEHEQIAQASNSAPVSPSAAIAQLDELKAQLAESDTVVAAFDDLQTAVEASTSTRQEIQSCLTVLTCTLELAGHLPAQVCRFISEIVDDQQREIELAHQILDGAAFTEPENVDVQAGLLVDDRLALARRYLRRPSESGHHIVWLAFERARLSEPWRDTVGPVDFFDGPTLLEKMKATDSVAGELPGELTSPAPGLEWDRTWPVQPDDVELWVAARVDLGTGNFADPVGQATDHVNAIVQLARFNRGGSTWEQLEGHIYFVDGRWRTINPFGHRPPELDLKARQDTTAGQFQRLAVRVEPHLPITDPRFRRLLVVLRDINESSSSDQPELLLGDVRAIEFVSRQCGTRKWTEFMIEHTSVSHAWNSAVQELFNAVHAVFWDFTLDVTEGRHDLLDRIEKHKPDGTVTRDYAATFDLVDYLLQGAPTHHPTLRRLRDVQRHIQSPTSIQAWVEELEADYRRRVARTRRLRNGLTHSGAARVDLLRTVRNLINVKARNLAQLALDAILAKKDISTSVTTWRDEFENWKSEIASAPDPKHALIGKVGTTP